MTPMQRKMYAFYNALSTPLLSLRAKSLETDTTDRQRDDKLFIIQTVLRKRERRAA